MGYPTKFIPPRSPYPFAPDPEIIAQLEKSLNTNTAENFVASFKSGPRTLYDGSVDFVSDRKEGRTINKP